MTDRELEQKIRETMEKAYSQKERFNITLGLEFVSCNAEGPGVVYSYGRKEAHLNPTGIIHGGIVASLADTAAGIFAVACAGKFTSTTDMYVSYLKPLQGEEFLVKVRSTHMGKKMCSFAIDIEDKETGVLCSTAMARYMIMDNVTMK